MDHPLKNPDNWVKPKTWIVPLEFTVMVDDPTKYDLNMKTLIQRIENELKTILRLMDKSQGQIRFRFLSPVKDADKFVKLIESVESKRRVEEFAESDMLEKKLNELLDKKLKELGGK